MDNSTESPLPLCCFVSPTGKVVFVVVDSILFLAIIFGNTLVILSVATDRRLQTPTNMFLASLAVADLFVAFFCLPTAALFGVGLIPTVSPVVCITGSVLSVASFLVSLNHLTVVAYDRFLAITKPFKYGQQMNPRRVALLIALAWSSSTLYSLSPLFGWNRIDSYDLGYCDMLFIHPISFRFTTVVLGLLIPISLMGYMYIKIFRVAVQHKRRIAAESRAFNRPGERSLASDLKAAKTLAIVFSTFIVATTPASFVALGDQLFPVRDLRISELVCFRVLYANSAMNPITYAFRSQEFRSSFLKLLGKLVPFERRKITKKPANQSQDCEMD